MDTNGNVKAQSSYLVSDTRGYGLSSTGPSASLGVDFYSYRKHLPDPNKLISKSSSSQDHN